MVSILLIDDEDVWLSLIRRALPDYQVDQAQTYEGALTLLAGGMAYDVAIVDLNLLETGRDQLGGKLLEIMRDQHPATRRIALTGLPPTSVKDVFDRWDVDDLLLKGDDIDLARVRAVVEAALRRSGDLPVGIPAGVKAEKSVLLMRFHTWRKDVFLRLDQRAQTLDNDIQEAVRLQGSPEGPENRKRAVEQGRQQLEGECSVLSGMLDNVRSLQDIAQAWREFDRLRISTASWAQGPGSALG